MLIHKRGAEGSMESGSIPVAQPADRQLTGRAKGTLGLVPLLWYADGG